MLDAIEAVQRLEVQRPTVLAIWGAGPLERRLRTHRDGACLFLGPLDLADVPMAFHSSDLVVIPSKTTPWWKEQFGRVAVEAMLSGRPVVAYRSGALPSVLDEGAVLVDEGDVEGLTSNLERLLRDEAERVALGERARESALRRFHPELLAGRIISFWEGIVGGRRAAPSPQPG